MSAHRIAAFALLAVACAPRTEPAPAGPPGAPGPDGAAQPVERPELSASDCESQGGTVVGDIGDGAIHRPDYVCPESGEPPLGTISAEPDGPIAVEGSVCCKGPS